ncbi:MAG: alpha/beta hydrolase [Cyclobacteriaceae bacterium]|nr:alpha/beta hydrolase [Cyclobacteriaceae bacterium]UYN88386.1 MAG: alpha/beta hydrolase [Cyclobacteriaceae bacterium]
MKKLSKWLGYGILIVFVTIFLFLAFNYKADIPVEALEEKYFTPESAYLEIDDVKLHLRKRGEGPAIFLIHGSFASLHTWQGWENELSKSFTTISMDLPGHGLTGPTKAEDYTTDYYAKLIFNLADKLMIDTFYVAGNSMGGNVAWKMALHQPDRIKKLILVDAAGFWKITSDSTIKPTKRPFIFTLLSNDAVGKVSTKITPYFLFKSNLQHVYGDKTKAKSETIERYYELMLREGNREATLKRLRNSGRDLQDSIPFIKTPTLILWGKKDAWIPVEHAHRFHQAIEHSRLIIFDHAGHVPMEETPNQSVEAALSFLKE